MRKFYTIRDLETEKEIVRVSNWNLVVNRNGKEMEKDIEENYPSYSSKAKKTPADYGLKGDSPNLYIGLNSQEVQNALLEVRSNIGSYSNKRTYYSDI